MKTINNVLSNYNLSVSDKIDSAQATTYRVDLANTPSGVISKLNKISLELKIALDDDSINVYRQGRYLYIERKKSLDVVKFKAAIDNNFFSKSGLLLALGKDLHGNKVVTNLSKAPHILVAGCTGSGKSETLHSMLASLISRYSIQPVGITIIDMKGTEFRYCKDADFVWMIDDSDNAFKALQSFCIEMDTRYKELAEIDCADVSEAYEKGYLKDKRFIPQVIIIDELADLMLKNKKVENEIVRIAQKGRAAGLHLILATQRPSHDVITGLIKANIPVKIALATSTALDSRIILGVNGAEKLYGKGDMLFSDGNDVKRLQGAFVTNDDKNELKGLIEKRNNLLNVAPKKSFIKRLFKKGVCYGTC
jgi:S-DNA-T family DNA segregation ATPase FtsK/SpoIIIE